jgi:hypothetical protein
MKIRTTTLAIGYDGPARKAGHSAAGFPTTCIAPPRCAGLARVRAYLRGTGDPVSMPGRRDQQAALAAISPILWTLGCSGRFAGYDWAGAACSSRRCGRAPPDWSRLGATISRTSPRPQTAH